MISPVDMGDVTDVWYAGGAPLRGEGNAENEDAEKVGESSKGDNFCGSWTVKTLGPLEEPKENG